MSTAELSPQLIAETARTDLARACELARALVAAQPEEEAAARLLCEVVQEFARSVPAPTAPSLQLAAPVREALRLLAIGQDEQAEIELRRHLRQQPNDTSALELLAHIAMQCGFPADAQKVLRRALEIDPSSAETWAALGKASFHVALSGDQPNKADEAIAAFDEALRLDPTHELSLSFKAAILVQVRRLDEGEASLQEVLGAYPVSAYAWTNLGFLLKTVGRFGDAVAAYRTAFAMDIACGAAWWGLANMKRAHFFPFDLQQMEAAIALPTLAPSAAIDIHFALSKAWDDRRDYAQAADHLLKGNALRRESLPHSAEGVKKSVDAAIEVFTPAFFGRRTEWGHASKAPIFILGMPRSGSTLLEQILSSHSRVEATEELFVVPQLSGELAQLHPQRGQRAIEDLTAEEMEALGERYIQLARVHRRTDHPRFTDKNPNNWRQIGLILSMLPNAKVVDIRRNPLDCCLANYMQHFMFGGSFSYSQSDMARYYRDYWRMLRHFDRIAPGKVHRVIYEDLVDDLEGNVRGMLEYLELPFEDSCLRFFETERAILTPSSQQVRQPINRSGIGRWLSYEPWLVELKETLGELITVWRN